MLQDLTKGLEVFNLFYPAAELICLMMGFPLCSKATLGFCRVEGKLPDQYSSNGI